MLCINDQAFIGDTFNKLNNINPVPIVPLGDITVALLVCHNITSFHYLSANSVVNQNFPFPFWINNLIELNVRFGVMIAQTHLPWGLINKW